MYSSTVENKETSGQHTMQPPFFFFLGSSSTDRICSAEVLSSDFSPVDSVSAVVEVRALNCLVMLE